MHIWPVQDAKARFSEFLDACITEGPQVVTRRGTEAAVLVPIGGSAEIRVKMPHRTQIILSVQ